MMHTESWEGAVEHPEAGLVRHADGRRHASPPPRPEARALSPPHQSGAGAATRPQSEGGGSASPPPGHPPSRSRNSSALAVRLISAAFESKPSNIPTHSETEAKLINISRRLLYAFYVFGTVFAAIIIWQLVAQHTQKHVVAWSVGAIFVSIAVPFSLHDIHMHTGHYVNPKLQKYYLRILWMVPIYSIESWLALRFRAQKIYLETAREAYEAYVIYNFYMLMLNFLGGGKAVREILKKQSDAGKKYVTLFPPFCCWKWKRSGQFINRCTVGVFQYVIIRFFLAFVTCLVEYMELKEVGNQHTLGLMVDWIIGIINVSQIWAMYCLVQFYHELKEELHDISPFWKFVVVKTVVFLSFWQGLAIMGLAHEGYITSYMDYSQDDVASGIQDFLICIEMAAISYAHQFVFSYRDMEVIVKPEDMHPLPPCQAWYDILPWDVVDDFREQIFNGFGLVHKIQKHQKHKTMEGAVGGAGGAGELGQIEEELGIPEDSERV